MTRVGDIITVKPEEATVARPAGRYIITALIAIDHTVLHSVKI